MIVLGIDTATRTATVGLLRDEEVLCERSVSAAHSLGATTVPLVDDVLRASGRLAADIDLIAVSAGPGSFTGLRVGLSIAKGMALSTGCAVVAVPTLEALAHVVGMADSGLAVPIGSAICPVLDARKGEVYAALYRVEDRGTLICEVEEQACDPLVAVEGVSGSCIMIGDGVAAYREVWAEHFGERATLLSYEEYHPRGSVVASLGARRHAEHGADDPASVVPRYCRKPEAQVAAGR